MLFPGCLTEVKQSFFLQRRNSKLERAQNKEVMPPQSKFNQKISLKTLKSIKSQKSLKTISTNEDIRPFQSSSLNYIRENERNNVHIVSQKQDFNFFLNLFPQTERMTQKTIKVSNIQRRTLDLSVNPLPKICISYQKNDKIRNFVSSDPRATSIQIPRQQQPKILLKTPKQESKGTQVKEIETISQQNQIYSISVTPCVNNGSLQIISEGEKEQDMKSTHIGEEKLQLPLYFPSKAKSTVSMLSQRSSCQSIIMDHEYLKIQGKISKLL